MAPLLLLAAVVLIAWMLVRARRRQRMVERVDRVARISGVPDGAAMFDAAVIAGQAGIPPEQAGHFYRGLLEQYDRGAVHQLAEIIRHGGFTQRFPGCSIEAALGEICGHSDSSELSDWIERRLRQELGDEDYEKLSDGLPF